MEKQFQKEGYQTLSILDIKKQFIINLISSIFLLLFSIIYAQFSHGVSSNYMTFAFLIPLIMGFIPISLIPFHKKISKKSNFFLQASIITLSLGSILMGVLEIYGTTNSLVNYYFPIGFILLGISIFLFLLKKA